MIIFSSWKNDFFFVIDVDECLFERAVCMFGGVCINIIGLFKCVCFFGRLGFICVIGKII